MSPTIARAAASAGGAVTISAGSRGVVQEIRRAGGSTTIGALRGSPHDLAGLLVELGTAGLVEIVGGDGAVQSPASVGLALRSGGFRARARAQTVRLTAAADRTALRVPAGG